MKVLCEIETATMYATVAEVALSDIGIPEGRAPRNLVRSIAHQGVIEPVILKYATFGDNQFEVVAGRRRLQACRELKLESVVSLVRAKAESETALASVTLSENLVRSRNLLSEVEAFRELRMGGLDDDVIQSELGLFRRDVRGLETLSQMAPATEEALRTGKISPSSAKTLAKLPPDVQEAFFSENPPEKSKYTLKSVQAWRMRYLFPSNQMSCLETIPMF